MQIHRRLLGGKAQGALRIGITILFFFVVNRSLTAARISDLLGHIAAIPLLVAALLGVAGFAFQVLRWEIVLSFQGFTTRNGEAVKTMLWGSLLAFVTPGRFGELIRGLELDPQRKSDSVIAVMIDRLYAIAVTILFGILGMGVQYFAFSMQPLRRFSVPMAVVIAAAAVGGILLRRISSSSRAPRRIATQVNRVKKLIPALRSVFGKRVVVYSLLAHMALILQTMTLLHMFGSGRILANFVVACQAYAFMLLLPFFVANVGLREYSFALFLTPFLAAVASSARIASVALGVSSFVLLINIIFPALGGVLWALLAYAGGARRAKAIPVAGTNGGRSDTA